MISPLVEGASATCGLGDLSWPRALAGAAVTVLSTVDVAATIVTVVQSVALLVLVALTLSPRVKKEPSAS